MGPARASFARVMMFRNSAMATDEILAEQAQRWIDESGSLPPGNGPEAALFEGSEGAPQDVASPGPRSAAGPAVSSPFSQAQVHRTIAEASVSESDMPVLTIEAAEACLDEVRPYLLADGEAEKSHHPLWLSQEHLGEQQGSAAAATNVCPGSTGGDVVVRSVDAGIVALQLQGSCSTCAASSATMKMGLERALRANFGSQVRLLPLVHPPKLQEDGNRSNRSNVGAVPAGG